MDLSEPPYSQQRYDEIKTNVSAFMANNGWKPDEIPFIPIKIIKHAMV
jgi:elongation factor 1-alpha